MTRTQRCKWSLPISGSAMKSNNNNNSLNIINNHSIHQAATMMLTMKTLKMTMAMKMRTKRRMISTKILMMKTT